jgi:hypothetical protein
MTDETRDLTFGIYDTLTDHHHCYADVVLAPAGEDGEPDWSKADPANVEALPADEWPDDEQAARRACVIVSNVDGCDPDATFIVRLNAGTPELIHIHGPESDRPVAEQIIARDIGAEPPKREPSKLQKSAALLRARLLSPLAAANDNTPSPSKMDSWGKFTFTWFDDIGTEAKKETVVKGMLTAGEFTMISGLPGTGKSVIVTDLACHIAAGMPWMGKKVKQGLVVYVAAERKKLTERRMLAFRKKHGVKDLPLLVLGGLIDMTTGTLHATAIAMAVKKAAEITGQPCVWIIIDTLTRTFGPGDQHQSKDMAKYVRSCDTIIAETGSHLTVVHHTAWSGERGKGAIDLDGAVDASFMVKKNAAGHVLECDGTNDGEEGVICNFRMESVNVGTDEDGEPITAPVVVKAVDVAGFVKTATQTVQAKAETELMDILTDLSAGGHPIGGGMWQARYHQMHPDVKENTIASRWKRAVKALEESGRVQSSGTPKVYVPAEVQNLGANEVHAPDALAPAPSDHSDRLGAKVQVQPPFRGCTDAPAPADGLDIEEPTMRDAA